MFFLGSNALPSPLLTYYKTNLSCQEFDGAELEALEPPAAGAVAAWLADARVRLAADRAVAALGARAVSRLRGADG